jgi:hypothetical protein
MNISDCVNMALTKSKKRKSEMAEYWEVASPAVINMKFVRDSWSGQDLVKLAEFTGAKLMLVYPDGDSIRLFRIRKKPRRRMSMDKKRQNELILLSQQICDSANGMLKEYLEKTYAEAGPESMGDQLEDWLYLAEETSAYLLGNAVAMLAPEVRDAEIEGFEKYLRKVILKAEEKFENGGAELLQ